MAALVPVKAPADGVKAEASLADEEKFAFMFATAEQCDAGLLNPASDWHKMTLGDRAVYGLPPPRRQSPLGDCPRGGRES